MIRSWTKQRTHLRHPQFCGILASVLKSLVPTRCFLTPPVSQVRIPSLIVSKLSGQLNIYFYPRSMRTMSYADKTITCRDCGMDFAFTSGEQDFYAQKGFTNDPTRCPSCRQARKANGGGRSSGGYSRDSYSSGGYDDRESYSNRGGSGPR